MAISTKLSQDGKTLTIVIDGRFDFGMQNAFRGSYEKVSADEYVVDLHNAEYMDSSALGMLLMMREHAGGSVAKITLKDCSQDIKTILSVANFQNLFRIA